MSPIRYRRNSVHLALVMLAVTIAPPRTRAATSPTAAMGIQLLDTANNPLPQSTPGTYVLSTNQQFRVLLTATLSNPYITDEFHLDENFEPLPQIELGIQTLTVRLLTEGGPTGMVTPLSVPDPPRSFPVWALDATTEATRYFRHRVSPAFYNVLDFDHDGDVDAAPEYGNNNAIFAGYGDLMEPEYVAGLQNGLGSQTRFVMGGYTTAAMEGVTTLTTMLGTVNAFTDRPEPDARLGAVRITDVSTPATITLVVVPEPAAIVTILAAPLALLRAPRRKKTPAAIGRGLVGSSRLNS